MDSHQEKPKVESFKLSKSSPEEATKQLRAIMSLVVLFGAIWYFNHILNLTPVPNNNQPIPTPTLTETKAVENQLKLLSFTCTQEYGFFEITGQVKNISKETLKNVEAEGGTYTHDGQFINSESSLIEYNPILSGQTSPFKVMMTYNPAMSKCDVNFKFLMGGSINTEPRDSK